MVDNVPNCPWIALRVIQYSICSLSRVNQNVVVTNRELKIVVILEDRCAECCIAQIFLGPCSTRKEGNERPSHGRAINKDTSPSTWYR